jgi:beta-glucosidase
MRWGRVYEAFSDNSSLNGNLGEAYISGTQTIINNSYVLATAKHYFGNGAMEWGQSNHKYFKIDQGKITADETVLTNEYLPPFKSAINADVSSIMVGLSQWGDQRIIDSKYLLTDRLKNELGFKGFVVSDWYGVYEYSKTSRYDANVKTINAGLDMAMLPYDYKAFLSDVRKAVNKGDISQKRIDDAVSRILYQKFKAGLFDAKPNITGFENVGSDKHRELARKAVSSSAVLLKNDNNLLPLSKNTDQILIAGSGADNIGRQSGAWTVEWQGVDGNWMPGGSSILQGIKQVVGKSYSVNYRLDGNFEGIATKSKIGIVIISEKPYAEGWGDNANPTIDSKDLQAITNMKKYSDKVIVIILSGRPLIITDQIKTWDALIVAWLPGSEGIGVADVLFGNNPFTAKLPVVWPANIQQVPIKTDGSTNDGTKPLFMRGFGL